MLRFVLLTTIFALSFGNGFCQSSYYEDYLIPDGYVGYVRVIHEVEGASPLPVEEGRIIYKFDESGILKTSDKVRVGSVYAKYYYYTDKEKTLLLDKFKGEGGMIHDESVINTKLLDFFVGTEKQYSLWYQSENCGKAKPPFDHSPGNIKQCLEDFEKSQKEKPQNTNQPK